MSVNPKVALLPSHPSFGWESMNRYHDEILGVEDSGLQFVTPFGRESMVGAPVEGKLAQNVHRFIRYPQLIKSLGPVGLYHILDHSFSDLLTRCPKATPKVVTVHDLLPLSDEVNLTPSRRRRFFKRVQLLKKADHLVCVSDYTAQDVMQKLEIPSDKITVNLNGVNRSFFSSGTSVPEMVQGYKDVFKILILGTSNPRKNLAILPEVIRRIGSLGKEVAVIKAGRHFDAGIRSELMEVVDESMICELGFCPEGQLPNLLGFCDVLFFPSLAEGFGLPVLEAMAAGCPVVCSNRTSIPEVGGDAVLYFDPTDIEEGAAQIRRLIEEPKLSGELIEAGRERASSISWENHVKVLSCIYRDLTGS